MEFEKWLKMLSYPIEWCSPDEPIILGSEVIRNNQPSYWLNRPIQVIMEDSIEQGTVIEYIDDDTIIVRWDDGEETSLDFKNYECLLKTPYIFNRDIVKRMAKELWNVLLKIPKCKINIDYNSFERDFIYLIYEYN
mgnify:CR=1 FL=1